MSKSFSRDSSLLTPNSSLSPGVSLIILTKEGADHLNNLLSSFFQTNTYSPVELLIIDHASTDNTRQIIAKYISQGFIRHIKRDKNYSFAQSCNYGASKAKYPYLLFCNNDIIYTSDVLPKAAEALEKDESVGAVGIRLDDASQESGGRSQETEKKEQTVQHLGIEFKWNEKRGYHQPEQIRHPSLKDFLSGCDQQPEKISEDSCRFVDKNSSFFPAVTGAFMLLRKSDFQALNGFDESYNYGLEDIDFCLRLSRDLNKKCLCINDISLQHDEGATRKKWDKETGSRIIEKNHQIFKERWDIFIRSNILGQPKPDQENADPKASTAAQLTNNNRQLTGKPQLTNNNESLNILFVLPHGPDSNNGYQVQLLSRMLQTQGARCTIAVPDSAQLTNNNSLLTEKSPLTINYSQLTEKDASASFDIVHAWTPREIVREFCQQLLDKHECPLIIHLEDNEEYLTEVTVGKPWKELAALPDKELDKLIPKKRYHPVKGRRFLDQAQVLTMVIETLNRFNPNGLPYQVLPPMVDERLFYPRPINKELRAKHKISDETTVLVYTGNIHAGNKDEVYELYKAVELLNQQGHPTVLLRTGLNNKNLGIDSWPSKQVINLGWVAREELPEIMAAADMFVQPGKPGPFNDERVPCKLPECFAMGRPVVLPRTNLGTKIKHGKEGYVLDAVDAEGIVQAVSALCQDKAQNKVMGKAAIDFYLQNLAWRRKDPNEYDFYLAAMGKKKFESQTVVSEAHSNVVTTSPATIASCKFSSTETKNVGKNYNKLSTPDSNPEIDISEGQGKELGLIFLNPKNVIFDTQYEPASYTSRQKKLFVLLSEIPTNNFLYTLYALELFASTHFLDLVLVVDDADLIKLVTRVAPIWRQNRHVYFAYPKKQIDTFLSICIRGQPVYDRLIIVSDPVHLTQNAAEYAKAMVLDLRRFSQNDEKIRIPEIIGNTHELLVRRNPDAQDLTQKEAVNKAQAACTLITSIFKSDKYLETFLKNCQGLEGYDQDISHIALVSKVSDFEAELIQKWLAANQQAVLVWNREDPGLYECWNLGIRLAQTEFVSNANVDDLRHPKQVKTLVQDLRQRPHVSIGATALMPFEKHISDINEIQAENPWYADQAGEFGFTDLARLEKKQDGTYKLEPHNMPHCMPVWRKELHKLYGYFDENRFGTYADWAFWLKATKAGEKGYLDPAPLSFYFVNPGSHNRRGDKLESLHRKVELEFLESFYCRNIDSQENNEFDVYNDILKYIPFKKGNNLKKKNILLVHFGRSGSTVLGDLLNQNSHIKWHGEIYTLADKKGYQFQTAFDFLDYTNKFTENESIINGVELKYINYIQNFEKKYHSIQNFYRIIEIFPRIGFLPILLIRNNILKRIVSVHYANKTGGWHVKNNEEKNASDQKLKKIELPVGKLDDWDTGSRGSLNELLHKGVQYNTFLEDSFIKNEWPIIYYEKDIENDPLEGYLKIINDLNLDRQNVKPSFMKTSTSGLNTKISNFKAIKEQLNGCFGWMIR